VNLGNPPSRVRYMVRVAPENWSFGNGEMQYAPK
jgi:hypothetical protein